MIGLRTWHHIDQRLCQIRATSDMPFGGMSVLLGDFAQLSPVFDKPLYKQASADRAAKVHAQLMYEKFDRSVFLKQVVRQAGDSQNPFQDPGCATRWQSDVSIL
ncbi:hypothetical protein E4U27_006428 [Claviceps purpurea]|nr:hypothetical protein E4U27_006428 [Claviceps purpurea]